MNSNDLLVMSLVLGATCLLAAGLAWRSGNDRRNVRLMAAFGAALGGLAFVLSPLALA